MRLAWSSRSASSVVHCWPLSGTYWRSSSQIGQLGGGESLAANWTPQVLHTKWVMAPAPSCPRLPASRALHARRRPRRAGSAGRRAGRAGPPPPPRARASRARAARRACAARAGSPTSTVRPFAIRSRVVTSVAEPEAKPNSSSRPPGPSSSIAARPSSPPTPSSTTLSSRSPSALADALGPAGLRVVDRDVGAERAHALGLGGAAGDADGERAGVARRLQEEGAEAARGRGHEHGVVGLEPRGVEDADRGAAGADHRHRRLGAQVAGDLVQRRGGRERELRVAAVGLPEVGDHAAPAPALVGARAEQVDGAGDLAAGRHRQLRAARAARPRSRRGSSCRSGAARRPRPRSAPARRPGRGRGPPRSAASPRGRTRAGGWRAWAAHASRAPAGVPRAIGPRPRGVARAHSTIRLESNTAVPSSSSRTGTVELAGEPLGGLAAGSCGWRWRRAGPWPRRTSRPPGRGRPRAAPRRRWRRRGRPRAVC